MASELKKLSSPFSSGGGGVDFEISIQSLFVLLMLCEGVFPGLCSSPIEKLELQSKYRKYNTDDIIIYSKQNKKMVAQIKHSLKFREGDENFKEVIKAAWADFNNREVFNDNTDKIALITGLLSSTDTNNVRNLLNNSRASGDAADFFNRVKLPKFSSENQRNKLRIFQNVLKAANDDKELSQEQVWKFLKCFYLFVYDLDMNGVVLSFLHTLLEQCSPGNSNAIWCQIKNYVASVNKTAGFITRETVPEEIQSFFKPKTVKEIPEEFINEPVKIMNWATSKYAHELAIVFFVGSWNENSEADKLAVSKIAQEDYLTWISKIRELLQEQDSPLTFKNGVWRVKNRKELFCEIKSMIFDIDLDCFKETSVLILKEEDPQFELDAEKRFAANIYNKVTKHSAQIREGISQGLAIIGSNSEDLVNCSRYKGGNITYTVLAEVFEHSTWQLWAGLNSLLPDLCESSPNKFLDIVNEELKKSPCVFTELFNQEGRVGITGCNYVTGLLWALERLAWNEELLSEVTLILGELANIDPGGNWGNRPANTLRDIFLPWYPQTTASTERRINAIKILNKELPQVAWTLLQALCLDRHSTTSGTAKPEYRNYVPGDWEVKVTVQVYNNQITFFSEFLVEQSKSDIHKIEDLVERIYHFPEGVFDKYINIISSDFVKSIDEDDRQKLWEKLTKLVAHHKHFKNSDWAMNEEKLQKIENAAKIIEPKKQINLYARLFSLSIFEEYDTPYGEGKTDSQKINNQLEELRKNAIEKILEEDDSFSCILQLIEKSDDSYLVGAALGKYTGKNYDNEIFPSLLNTEAKEIRCFIGAYIGSKFCALGWDWVDNIDFAKWSKNEILNFFCYLPFKSETWAKVSALSTDIEDEYWKTVDINPYQAETDIYFAIDKLLEYKRPFEAINCINVLLYQNMEIKTEKIIQALNLAVEVHDGPKHLNYHHITKLINNLQNSEEDIEEDLFSIELKYFTLLDGHHGARPVAVYKRLQKDPGLFCECIQLIYRSDKQNEEKIANESASNIAWHILYHWNKPPGLRDDGTFFVQEFNNWYEKAIELCTESGHLAVAKIQIGKVLFYTPQDSDGFWINKTVAELLNHKDNEEVRRGFRSECINSRGVHSVDPTAKPEKDLSEKYKKQAESCESQGYGRLAKIMRDIAHSYEEEAKRILEGRYK